MKIGVLGGGQLARMLALAGHRLGLRVFVVDPAESPCSADVATHHRAAFDDPDALAWLATHCDVVTTELEAVPTASLTRLGELVAAVHPNAKAIGVLQDRRSERELCDELGIAVAPWADANAPAQRLAHILSGCEAVVKLRRSGYDGRGQRFVDCIDDIPRALAELGHGAAIVERRVAFERELSQVSVRSRYGELHHYPLVQNDHVNGILHQTHAPAPGVSPSLQLAAETIAESLLAHLDYVGVMAVELFEVEGRLLVNEIAPRVHNSGHWTIEGAATSQFENHLRAVSGLPLGSTEARGDWLMTNLVGRVPPLDQLMVDDTAVVHVYGKQPRPGRKLGHVTRPAASDGPTRVETNSRDIWCTIAEGDSQ